MQTILFAVPLKSGKLDAYKTFTAECTGPRKEEYADLLKRYGLRTVKVWHHTTDGKEYIMVLHDAEENTMELLASWPSSTHPFDRWFAEQCLNCYDIESFEKMPPSPDFLFSFDY